MSADPTGFAVVELFTSEGCSSCPSADDVLNRLAEDATQRNLPVYALAFHVDYWDTSGWRDPYSASWATQYQRAYQAALSARGLYTPQMVVNGREEFIGSHAAQARASIAQARSMPRRAQLQVSMRREAERAVVHYDLSSIPKNSVLRVALVDPEATTDVPSGENAGRRLRHVHVVRGFASAPLAARNGDVSVRWPSDFSEAQRERAFVVAYVQDRTSMAIAAAARAGVSATRE